MPTIIFTLQNIQNPSITKRSLTLIWAQICQNQKAESASAQVENMNLIKWNDVAYVEALIVALCS